MALTIGPGVTVEGGITAGNVPLPEPTDSLLFNGSNQYLMPNTRGGKRLIPFDAVRSTYGL